MPSTPEVQRVRQARRREAGVCPQCGRPITDNPNRCTRCLQRARVYQARRYADLRRQVCQHYGNRCACCGETELVFLTIDHVNNDGASRRRAGESKSAPFLKWIIDQGFPRDLQLLCWNCNMAKRYRPCPHQGLDIPATM